MLTNYAKALPLILKHEGGFVNHPNDPGGATNKGVTIGTLKRLGIDVDGDGDSDIVDLRSLRQSDVERVYKLFYWDAVKADHLPSGVDYAVADFAVNSGPSRGAKHLQKVVGVAQDGDIGPKTLAAVAKRDPQDVVSALCDSRLRFLRGLKTWGTFGKGWGRRVAEVRAIGLAWADAPHVSKTAKTEHEPRVVSKAPVSDIAATAPKTPAQRAADPKAPTPAKDTVGGLAGGLTGGGVVLALVAFGHDIAQGWHDFWVWAFSFIN